MDGFWTAYGAHSYVPHFSRNASTGTYLRNVITGFEIMKACEQSSGCLAALASQFHKAVAAALSSRAFAQDAASGSQHPGSSHRGNEDKSTTTTVHLSNGKEGGCVRHHVAAK